MKVTTSTTKMYGAKAKVRGELKPIRTVDMQHITHLLCYQE